MKKLTTSLLGVALLCGLALPALARDISGKVVAVYYEPVTINNKVLDKVSVTVNNCATNQWETASYTPGSLSDDNSLGFLFNDLANAARSMVTKSQYMNSVSGHVTLAVNEQNHVQKTTFWGYNWECGQDIDGKASPMPGASGGMNTTPAAQPQPAAAPNPFGKMRRLGF